ncbi:ATP-binding protein [Marinomonas shanghaiensis]|uniref:ATP-binding protein n=1 Tax=Marinomonas shanghaiensis TaxID=2202418 RepID=UPI000DB9877D|nr:ATP-binding protein [Marinomonas shanghaiensis]
MILSHVYNKEEHDQTIIDCFLQMWRYSADLMFIMAVEDGDEFSLYDNNPASKAVMGLENGSEIHRLNLRVQFGDEMAEQVFATYRQVILNRTPVSIEQAGIRGDGSRIYFDTLFVPIFDLTGKAVFVCGVSRDITKIKDAELMALQANEKLLEYSVALETINQDLDRKVQERTKELESAKRIVEEALEAKSSFVARMSHEIRTPINAVIGLSHLSLKTPLNGEQQDYINKILTSGEVLLSLVNDVLDFSKIEAGKMSIEVVPFSPRSIVDYATNMVAIKAKEKKLTLTIDISSSLPPILLGDPLRIQQVLVNLMSNAVKFTERGGICVRVYAETNRDQDLLLRCDVIDTGIGIAKTFSEQLFQSFQQADDSITREFGGTGLGLAISRQLCELMGGRIWFNSEVGQGSTFSFSLPLTTPTPKKSPDQIEMHANTTAPDLSQYHILLVEDNIINQKVILGYLDETGIRVDVAGNGEEAISKMNRQDYSLIFMDIQMPVMDGLTATRKIRQNSKYHSIPIIAMTAHVSQEAKKQSASAGMNAHLDKPIKKIDLYKILQKHLNVREPHSTSQTDRLESGHEASSHLQLLSNLSSIDTLEVYEAVKSLGGKTNLYIDLVMAFYEKYQGVYLEEISGDKFFSILHSLKSNSAYIGAFTLSSYCLALENELNTDVAYSKKLPLLIDAFRELISQLNTVLVPHISKIEAGINDMVFSDAELREALEQITPLLMSSDFLVESHFDALRKMVRETKYAFEIEHIIDDVHNIEFETAYVKATQLILELQGD